jgi:hypothetical protein
LFVDRAPMDASPTQTRGASAAAWTLHQGHGCHIRRILILLIESIALNKMDLYVGSAMDTNCHGL